ncbi:MAG TPA: low temperature requirement protein A [Nitrososphaeraceae archaeon]|nr:low temperature requirement protein A [Nitrososphaeraceae archaeon]
MNNSKNNKNGERHATWLELFYDLVFVVTISQLSHYLLHEITLSNFFQFLFLFIPVWWSWVGTAFFATRFYSDDVKHRILLLLQMGGAGAMAVNISGAFSNTFSGFALSYAFMRLILVIEYVRVFRATTTHITSKSLPNPLIKRYIVGFSIAAIIWLISAFVPITEARFVLWVIGLIIDFATPITAGKLHSRFAPDISHLPERMGLFTLIVLGEAIAGIITGMTDQVWNIYSVVVASLGLCVSFSLWWLYFDSSGRLPIHILKEKGNIAIYYIWLYTHFPLVVAITAVGVGIRRLVSSDQHSALANSDLWLICGSVSMSLISQGILHLISMENGNKDDSFNHRKKFAIYRIISAVAIISIPILFGNYNNIPIVIASILTGICGIQIILDLKLHHQQYRT